MFEWKVEDMALLNQKSGIFLKGGTEKIYNCENELSREDKISFIDGLHDGKLSYLLELISKFKKDKESLPKDVRNNIKTVSLKAWIKRNDTRSIVDTNYHYGYYNLGGVKRFLDNDNKKAVYYGEDTYDDLVDEMFHRELKKLEAKEKSYFLEHDEYSILKRRIQEMMDKYSTTFGVPIITSSDGIYIGDFNKKRKITIEELKELLAKYEQIDTLIEKLTKETDITY